jgi:ParB family chromosome partitioning protein
VGKQEIPSIIKTLSDQESLEISLVENIQRENLNPMEEAQGYARLIKEFNYTQETIATGVGKNRATIANTLRLLTLPEEIQNAIREGALTMGHAKALLSVEDRAKQLELYRQIRVGNFSVRQAESVAGLTSAGTKKRRLTRQDPHVKSIEDELRRALGTKVNFSTRNRGGRIVIEYFSQEDLTRILGLFGISAS